MSNRPTSLSVVLHLGSRGPDVERVQGALKARGFFEGECNGLFGVDTEAAVQNFQRQSGLRVDGTVSPEVRAALLRDEKLEQAAQAAIHASVQATSVPGGSGVGKPPVSEARQPAPPQPLPVPMVPAAGESSPVKGGLLLVGGLIGLGVLLMWMGGETAPRAFGDFEDDSGLPPLVPGLDGDDDDGDATIDADAGGDPDPAQTPSGEALADTDIVPYGGGEPLKRGAKGRFLPRGA